MAIMILFNRTSTTLVYIASSDFAEKIISSQLNPQREYIYIHIDREYGGVDIYIGNDIKRRVSIEMDIITQIQAFAENDR